MLVLATGTVMVCLRTEDIDEEFTASDDGGDLHFDLADIKAAVESVRDSNLAAA